MSNYDMTSDELESWNKWFEICSVDGCPAEDKAYLANKINQVMHARAQGKAAQDDAQTILKERAGWPSDSYRFFDAWYSYATWSKQSGKGRSVIKPRKEWVRKFYENGTYNLQQSIRGGLLGNNSMSHLIENYLIDINIELIKGQTTFNPDVHVVISNKPVNQLSQIELTRMDAKTVKAFGDAFFEFCGTDKRARRNYEWMKAIYDHIVSPKTNTQQSMVPKATLSDRRKAIFTMFSHIQQQLPKEIKTHANSCDWEYLLPLILEHLATRLKPVVSSGKDVSNED